MDDGMTNSVGFYYNCFKNKTATNGILNQTRRFYPDSPIFLVSDQGDDFSDLAVKYNCKFVYSDVNVLGGRLVNGKRHMCFTDKLCRNTFIKNLSTAISYCQTRYIVLLEDDVYIEGQITEFPKDCGGDRGKNYFRNTAPNIMEKIEEKYGKVKFDYWSLSGGSIIKTESFLDCLKTTPLKQIEFFDEYVKLHNSGYELWHTNDILLSYIFMINGKTCEDWTNTKKSNIRHPDKRFYSKNLGLADGVYRNK